MQHDTRYAPVVSIVVCTYNRPDDLARCLASLHDDWTPTQTILITERGPLAKLRNDGLRQATAPLTLFLDDDVVVAPGYLSRLLRLFSDPHRMGVTGPSPIPTQYERHRALFRYPVVTRLYEGLFVAPEVRPGHLTVAGTFVPHPRWAYEGPVEFLEACHQAYRTDALKAVGGFDEHYGGVGDWSEPDLAFRMREAYGPSCLWFDPLLMVEHRCSPSGATALRDADAQQRLANYQRFAKQWVRPHWRHTLYHRFLEAYYGPWHTLKRLR